MAATKPKLHALLGLPPTVTHQEIVKAFKKAALAAYPDKGGNAETMVAVNLFCNVTWMRKFTDSIAQ